MRRVAAKPKTCEQELDEENRRLKAEVADLPAMNTGDKHLCLRGMPFVKSTAASINTGA